MAYNKSPFKMVGKSPLMKQLIGKQSMLPEGLQAAIKASPAKKYGHSPAKQLGKDAGETAAFEKSAQIEDKFNSKIEKAAGNDKKIAKLNKRANNKMARKVPRAQKKADKKGYDMNNFDGTTTRLVGKDQKSSPAKQNAYGGESSEESKNRLEAAQRTKQSSKNNRKAAQYEDQAARLDLKAQKQDRQKARKQKRQAKKDETGKTGVGEVMSKVGKRRESPLKQVKIKDLPEKAVETGEKILEGGKKFIKKIGNITLISKARQDCKKAGGKYSRKDGCFMPENKKKEAK